MFKRMPLIFNIIVLDTEANYHNFKPGLNYSLGKNDRTQDTVHIALCGGEWLSLTEALEQKNTD